MTLPIYELIRSEPTQILLLEDHLAVIDGELHVHMRATICGRGYVRTGSLWIIAIAKKMEQLDNYLMADLRHGETYRQYRPHTGAS